MKHNPTASPPPTSKLVEIFKEYEGLRIPRTATLVQGARQMGELRVVSGVDECLLRNEIVKKMYADEAEVIEAAAFILDAPFTGAPEI